MRKTQKPIAHGSAVEQDLDIDTLLAESIQHSDQFDTASLQKRIVELTDGLPQARPQARTGESGMLGWLRKVRQWKVRQWIVEAGFSWRQVASAVCVLIALVVLLPTANKLPVSPMVETGSSEQILLTEQELALEEFDGLVWQELVLLEEEIAFAAL